jgi:sugar phosphate isomerase/epimerase
MKFAICNEIFQEFPLGAQFALAQRIGYDAVEIAPFTLQKHVTEITPEQRQQITALAAQHKLEVAGIHWVLVGPDDLHITSPDADIRSRTKQYLCDLVRFGCDVGGRVMVLGSPKQRDILPGVEPEDARAWFAEAVAEAAQVPGAGSFQLCIEPLLSSATNMITTAAEACEMADRIGLPNVGVILDVNSMSHEETDLPAAIRASQRHLRHFHANDPCQRGPGWGEVDFRPLFEALLDIGYSGYVSVEVFDFSLDPIEHAEKSLEYLQATLAQVTGG